MSCHTAPSHWFRISGYLPRQRPGSFGWQDEGLEPTARFGTGALPIEHSFPIHQRLPLRLLLFRACLIVDMEVTTRHDVRPPSRKAKRRPSFPSHRRIRSQTIVICPGITIRCPQADQPSPFTSVCGSRTADVSFGKRGVDVTLFLRQE